MKPPEADALPLGLLLGRVSMEDYSPVLLTEPDMRARIRLFGLIDQNASDSYFPAQK